MTPLRTRLYTVIRTTERISIQRLSEMFKTSTDTLELHIRRLESDGYPIIYKNGYVFKKDYGFIKKLISNGNFFKRAKGKRVKL
jgi:biotin operon repressor